METKYLSRKEKLSFTVAAFGRSGIYTIMTMFYMVFLVDVVFQGMKNAGVTASTIILAGRIFDAANDPIMGMIVDRTRTKWGKMRPYLLFSPIPIAITTILLFWAPGICLQRGKDRLCGGYIHPLGRYVHHSGCSLLGPERCDHPK